MNESIPEPSPKREATTKGGSLPAPATPTRFPPDRLAFFQRLAENDVRDREAGVIARAHLIALENRVAQAAQALDLGRLGSARAFLEIGRRDYEAALRALPEV